MEKKAIESIMKSEYEFLVNKFGKDRILGIFGYGEINYGMLEEYDVAFTAIYLPTFEEICTNLEPKKEDIGYCHVVDIRLALDAATVQSNYFIESILTDYMILNLRYENVFFEYFKNNNQLLCELNPQNRVKWAASCGYNAAFNGDMYTAARLKAAIESYNDGVACEKCIKIYKLPYVATYLKTIIEKEKTSAQEELRDELLDFFDQLLSYAEVAPNNPEAEKTLKDGIYNIMKIAVQESVNKTDFIHSLTKKEKIGLEVIINLIGPEGNVSVSSLEKWTGLSRPVFSSLFSKLEQSRIAEVANQGVKGTYIKFLEDLVDFI